MQFYQGTTLISFRKAPKFRGWFLFKIGIFWGLHLLDIGVSDCYPKTCCDCWGQWQFAADKCLQHSVTVCHNVLRYSMTVCHNVLRYNTQFDAVCVCDITLLVWAALPSCDTPVVQSVRRQSEPSIYIMQPEFWILYTYLPRILWIHRHMCQPEGSAYWHIQQTPNFWLTSTGSALTLFLAEYNFRIWL